MTSDTGKLIHVKYDEDTDKTRVRIIYDGHQRHLFEDAELWDQPVLVIADGPLPGKQLTRTQLRRRLKEARRAKRRADERTIEVVRQRDALKAELDAIEETARGRLPHQRVQAWLEQHRGWDTDDVREVEQALDALGLVIVAVDPAPTPEDDDNVGRRMLAEQWRNRQAADPAPTDPTEG